MIINKPANHYKVAIIGAGPAGISIAKTLADKGINDILLIESGQFEYDKKQNELGKMTTNGDLTGDYFQQHNLRIFGGTSAVWGGFSTVMEQRAFDNKTWPLPYSDIYDYYPSAAKILELPESSWKQASVSIDGTDELVYKPFYLSDGPVRFGKKYQSFINTNTSVSMLKAHTVTKISSDTGKVTHLQISDSTLKQKIIKADYYILACGGINNARLLELSDIQKPGITGHNLMEHPHIYSYGRILASQKILHASRQTSGRRVDALQFSDKLCNQNDLLSFSVSLNDGRDDKGLPHTANNMLEIDVTIRSEMKPSSSNRISLSDSTDWLGQKNTQIDFSFNYDEILKKSWMQFGSSLLRSRLGRLTSYSDQYQITGGGHMIGTTRMGSDRANSIVDKNCKVHELDNLYIAGSSIFPAGGAANPTYTIVALAVRLANHISGHYSK